MHNKFYNFLSNHPSLWVGLIISWGVFILFAAQVQAGTNGTFLTKYIDQRAVLKSSEPYSHSSIAKDVIYKHIQTVGSNEQIKKHPDHIPFNKLANIIYGAAYCFDIDPFILTGLIQKESGTFYQYARSHTGAIGLGQFTTIGTQEVWDQLGQRGSKYAREDATIYLLSVLTSDCLANYGGYETMGRKYQHLWETPLASKYTKGSTKQARIMTIDLANKPETAVVYAAILLKTYLSAVEHGQRSRCVSYKPFHSLTSLEKYQEALMQYNGETCEVQLNYQKNIFSFYADALGVKAK